MRYYYTPAVAVFDMLSDIECMYELLVLQNKFTLTHYH